MEEMLFKCPNCAGTVKIEKGRTSGQCEYCDVPYVIDDGVIKIRYIDVAGELSAQLSQKEAQKKKEQNEKFVALKEKRTKQKNIWTRSALIYHAVCAALVILSSLAKNGSDDAPRKLLLLVFLLNMVCPIVLTMTRPVVPQNEKDIAEDEKLAQFLFLLVTSVAADAAGAAVVWLISRLG